MITYGKNEVPEDDIDCNYIPDQKIIWNITRNHQTIFQRKR